jgi:putative transposase
MSTIHRFITEESANYPITELCRVLRVSRSSYYGRSKHQQSGDRLAPRVSEVFWRHSRRYGSRRVAVELQAESKTAGERIGRRRVRRLMRKLKLRAIQPRRFVPRTTDSRHGQRTSPNRLQEPGLKIERPRQVIVGDITYLPLQGGRWAYLAIWLDLYTRKIVGWRVAETMTAALVIEALIKVIRREQPTAGLIVHSDRGGQYVATEFRALLKSAGFEQSMSRAGETYDNATAESLFSRYKAELLEGGAFASVEQARTETFAYIESYYNRVRRHSALGYQSPENFERAYYQRTATSDSLRCDDRSRASQAARLAAQDRAALDLRLASAE